MRELLIVAGGGLFLASSGLYLVVKLTMQPRSHDPDLYYELEDQNPQITRYNGYCRLTITGAAIGALLLFLAMV